MQANNRSFVAIALAAALSMPAVAKDKDRLPAPLPAYQVGDTFIFSDRRIERVAKIDGRRVTWLSRSGRRYLRDADFSIPVLDWQVGDQAGSREIRGSGKGLWPLKKGRSARFRVITRISSGDDEGARTFRALSLWSCKVKDYGPVNVAAGRFESYRIECERYSHNSMRLLERIAWDYAPAVGHYVRRERTSYFDGKSSSYELVAALPARRATIGRIRSILKDIVSKGED